MKRLLLLITAALALAVALPTVEAKGIPDHFTVEGPGIRAPYSFTMSYALTFDGTQPLAAPGSPGRYYVVRGYIQDDEFLLSPLHFYPQADGSALIYFVGAQDRGVFQQYDGRWYPALPEAAQIIAQAVDLAQLHSSLAWRAWGG